MLKTWLELHCMQIGLDSSRPWTGSRQHQRKTRSLKSSFPQETLFVECISPPSPFLKSYNILKPSKIITTHHSWKMSESKRLFNLWPNQTMFERLKPASHKNNTILFQAVQRKTAGLIQIYLHACLDDLELGIHSAFFFAIRMALV